MTQEACFIRFLKTVKTKNLSDCASCWSQGLYNILDQQMGGQAMQYMQMLVASPAGTWTTLDETSCRCLEGTGMSITAVAAGSKGTLSFQCGFDAEGKIAWAMNLPTFQATGPATAAPSKSAGASKRDLTMFTGSYELGGNKANLDSCCSNPDPNPDPNPKPGPTCPVKSMVCR